MSTGAIEVKEEARLRAGISPDEQAGANRQAAHPFVPAQVYIRELTLVPMLMGIALGLIFGASSLYLVLKVGLTVSASIPLAVISITLFRLFSRFGLRDSTILENNIVQTAGSAGENIAFGIGVTMPALLVLGFDLELINVLLVALIGGLLGLLLMILLRHGFIVREQMYLKYPEGTACAEILEAGATTKPQKSWSSLGTETYTVEQASGFSTHINPKTIFMGFGLSFLYQTLMSVLKLWKEFPTKIFGRPYEGGSVSLENNPSLLGIGYIIGPRIAGLMAAGGGFSYLILIPFIKYFGSGSKAPLAPETAHIIADMTVTQIQKAYVLYIGAGAIVAGSLTSLFRALPTIIGGLKGVLPHKIFSREAPGTPRTERDLPKNFIIAGIIMLTVMSMVFRSLHINFLGTLLMLLFSILFVRVSARITGEIGATANPVSGMTAATLLLICLFFLVIGWTSPPYYLTALSIGAIVCIALSNGGTTAQVLKTGYLVGATPRNQQIAILLGTLFSALVLGYVLIKLNESGTVYVPRVSFEREEGKKQVPAEQITNWPRYEVNNSPDVLPGLYKLLKVDFGNRRDFADLQEGEYLVDELSGRILYRIRENFPLVQADVSKLTKTEKLIGPDSVTDNNIYLVWQRYDTSLDLRGKYLCDQQGYPVYFVDPGINGFYDRRSSDGSAVQKFTAPKAVLMAYIIKGVLNRQFPWMLFLLGVMLAIVMELGGAPSLPFAVGLYLPFSTSTPILIGGLIRWLVIRKRRLKMEDEAEALADSKQEPGVMLSSGLIAGTTIAAILIALTAGFLSSVDTSLERWSTQNNPLYEGRYADFLSSILFMLLGLFLYLVGRGSLLPEQYRKRP